MKKVILSLICLMTLAACGKDVSGSVYKLKSSTCSMPVTYIKVEGSDFKSQGNYTLTIKQIDSYRKCTYSARAILDISSTSFYTSDIKKSAAGSCVVSPFVWSDVYDYEMNNDTLTLSNNSCRAVFFKD